MKAFIVRLRKRRGMTLVEVTASCLLLSIVMLAVFSFVSFSARNNAATLQNTSTQNELRLMMLDIKNEVVAALGGKIMDGDPLLASGGFRNTDTVVFFGISDDHFIIALKPPNKTLERIHEYKEIPHLDVRFEMSTNIDNMLIVTLSTNNNPNPRLRYQLQDEILLPNLSTTYASGITQDTGGGNCMYIITPNALRGA